LAVDQRDLKRIEHPFLDVHDLRRGIGG
jgi:hypothetical protein